MTLPNERTYAILRAREFLTRLSSPYLPDGIKKIPKSVRAEARAVLRHFPNWVDLLDPERSLEPEAANEYGERQEKEREQHGGL
jgi:hypothetical protein